MTCRALVVCAQDDTRETIAFVARRAGLEPVTAADGESALYLSGEHLFDAVVIALALPGMGADEVCRELRRRGRTGIVVVSDQRRRMAALTAGADDHVDADFSSDELAARLRAVVRRTSGSLARERNVRLGPLTVRIARGTATITGGDVELRSEDATVLGALAERPGCVVARRALGERLAAAHGRAAADRLDECLARLEAILDEAGAPTVRVVRGDGVVLSP